VSSELQEGIAVYENEEGDYWVRVDQAPTEEQARAAIGRGYPGASFVSHGIEVVPLSEHDYGDPRPGRRRRAWHFEMIDE
jgi:hypothetical protein